MACSGGVKGHPGGLSEYMLAEAELCAPCPPGWNWETCASLPLVGLTAEKGLTRGEVRSGQRVLIHAGAGGGGQAATQLARARPGLHNAGNKVLRGPFPQYYIENFFE